MTQHFIQGTVQKTDTITAAGSGTGAASIAASDTALVSANAGRTAIYICNDHASNIVYLSLGTTAVVNQGIRLNPNGGAVCISEWTGAIRAIATGASTTVTYVDIG